MAINDLTIGRREANLPTPFGSERSPFFQFRQEVDRLIDDVFRPAIGGTWTGGTAFPKLEVHDADKEVRITAELPGLKQSDVELSIDNGMLAISGERKAVEEDRERGWSERFYGRFERRVTLPDGIDESRAEADFRDGELIVKIPKSEEARKARKIPIKGSAPGQAA
jgi:HSP20 family protein